MFHFDSFLRRKSWFGVGLHTEGRMDEFYTSVVSAAVDYSRSVTGEFTALLPHHIQLLFLMLRQC